MNTLSPQDVDGETTISVLGGGGGWGEEKLFFMSLSSQSFVRDDSTKVF